MSPPDLPASLRRLRSAVAALEGPMHPRAQKPHVRVQLGAPCGLDAVMSGLREAGLYEVVPAGPGGEPAAFGFALALCVRFAAKRRAHQDGGLERDGSIVWIVEAFSSQESGHPHAPGLAALGLDPARLVVVETTRPAETLWAMEEALKSGAPAAVVAESRALASVYDLTASRRLLLAARAGGVAGVLLPLGGSGANLSSAADIRFRLEGRPSHSTGPAGGLRLAGAPIWAVRISKARIDGGRIDPQTAFHLAWDASGQHFYDADPVPLPASPADRPDQPEPARVHALGRPPNPRPRNSRQRVG